MRALVIDDSRAMRTLLGKFLTDLGYEVSKAEDGAVGLTTLDQEGPPDLILVDWNMPTMNGIEFVTAARKRTDCNDSRIMMVTTESDADKMIGALELGADEYLMKPFEKAALADKIKLLGLPAGDAS